MKNIRLTNPHLRKGYRHYSVEVDLELVVDSVG